MNYFGIAEKMDTMFVSKQMCDLVITKYIEQKDLVLIRYAYCTF